MGLNMETELIRRLLTDFAARDLGLEPWCCSPEDYAKLLREHCGESAFAAQYFPLFARQNETAFIVSPGCTPLWLYMTVSGDTLLMTTLSLCC